MPRLVSRVDGARCCLWITGALSTSRPWHFSPNTSNSMAGKCCGSWCREPLGGRSNDGPQGSSRDPLPARVFNGWRTYSILAAAARRPVGEEVTVPGAHFAVEGLRMTTNPRLMPESESTVFMAFHNRLAGTHTGG